MQVGVLRAARSVLVGGGHEPGAGEALIGAPADQEGVGLPRLLRLELVPVVTAIELEAPPRVLERFASRRLHDAVEGCEIGQPSLGG